MKKFIYRYEAGDHLGVFPENNKLLVEELCNLLNANMNEALLLINLDGTFLIFDLN